MSSPVEEEVQDASLSHDIDRASSEQFCGVGSANLGSGPNQSRPEHRGEVMQRHLVDALKIVHPVYILIIVDFNLTTVTNLREYCHVFTEQKKICENCGTSVVSKTCA